MLSLCTCKLAAKASYYSVVVLDLLVKVGCAKACKSSKCANSCHLSKRHAKNASLIGAIMILDIGRINIFAKGSSNSFCCNGFRDIVNYVLGIRNFFHDSVRFVNVICRRFSGLLGYEHTCSDKFLCLFSLFRFFSTFDLFSIFNLFGDFDLFSAFGLFNVSIFIISISLLNKVEYIGIRSSFTNRELRLNNDCISQLLIGFLRLYANARNTGVKSINMNTVSSYFFNCFCKA